MAIEFICPQCASVIRVPDEASGKKGSCPTCRTKLIVPTIEIPAESSPPSQFLFVPPPTEPIPQFPAAPIPPPQVAFLPSAPQPPEQHPASMPFDPFALPSTSPSARTRPATPIPNTPPANGGPAQSTANQPATNGSAIPPAPAWMKPQSTPPTISDVLFPSPIVAPANADESPTFAFLNAGNSLVPPAPGLADEPGLSQPGVGTRPVSMAARVRRRTKTKKSGMVFGLICGLALAAGMGYLYWKQGPSLEGNRKGIMLAGGKMLPKILSKSMIDVSSEVMETVLNDFADDPRRLRGQLVTTEFRGTLEGLEVTISTGSESRFVQFTIDSDLRKYYDAHQEELNQARKSVLAARSKEFFEKWDVAIRNSEGLENFNDYRDDVGLNTCLGGLGFHVSARVGKGLYPCVYEDDGSLYFAVPPSTKQFKVVGQFTHTLANSLFPGQYDVTVTSESKVLPTP